MVGFPEETRAAVKRTIDRISWDRRTLRSGPAAGLVLLALLPTAAFAAPRRPTARLPRPLAVDPAMRAWSDAHLTTLAGARGTLSKLSTALAPGGTLALTEVHEPTPTAAEAFADRQVDCVGFALLFAALARTQGVAVGFALGDVESIERRGTLRIERAHLLARFDDRVFDLGGEAPFDARRHQVIDDRTAIAVFFSNRGAQALTAARPREAVEHFYTALRSDPTLPRVWSNLGVALRRIGDAAGAVLALDMALRLDPHDAGARGNLAVARAASVTLDGLAPMPSP
jgi:tetratricopeptide (TPR) repeat protein